MTFTPEECFIAGAVATALASVFLRGPIFGLVSSRIAPAIITPLLFLFLWHSHFSEQDKLDVGWFLAFPLITMAVCQLAGGRRG